MDIIGYRDLNYYVFHYPDASGDQKRAINAWVNNLETHSILVFRDWDALGLDALLGWSASETLEFCFLDPAMDVHRENIVKFMKLGLRHPHPVLRYWLMHALESSGDAFFHTTQKVALQAEKEGVGPLDYLADRHDTVHREPGRSIEGIHAMFHEEPLTTEQIAIAEEMIHIVFDSVDHQLDLSYEAVTTNRFNIPTGAAPQIQESV